MGPSPAVAAVRCAVRDTLAAVVADHGPRPLVLAACSGGADSLALAAALAFEAGRFDGDVRAGAVTVDHGLQAGSAERAAAVAELLDKLGLAPVESVAVTVGADGGPEAAARAARYAALDDAAQRTGAAAVLLGHTLDDQAETVLLGLARGSGLRSLAGMAAKTGPGGCYRRPLLGLPRATTRAACADLGLPVWDDPHNGDPAFARSRVRAHVLPVLEEALGPGVASALARTADLARDDADALDGWAARALAELRGEAPAAPGTDDGLDVAALALLPSAVRRRVLRLAALAADVPGGSLAAVHLASMEALVTGWRGQGPVSLPGGAVAVRRYGRLYLHRPADSAAPPQPDPKPGTAGTHATPRT